MIDKCKAYQVFTGRLIVPDKRSKGLYLAYHLRVPLKLLNSVCDFLSRSTQLERTAGFCLSLNVKMSQSVMPKNV